MSKFNKNASQKVVSVVFIALILCAVSAGRVSAKNVSRDISDNPIFNEPGCYGDSGTLNLSNNYSLSSKIDGFFDAKKPVFVFFYTDWCHFCDEQKPIIDELENEYADKIAFICVNAEENPQAMNEFSVTGFPAMFLIIDENEEEYVYQEFCGFTDKEVLKERFDYVVGTGSLPEELEFSKDPPSAYPVLLVHGFMGSSNSMSTLENRLVVDNCYPENVYNIDLPGRGMTQHIEDYAALVKTKVEEIKNETGADKVIIISHSMGGLVSRYYITNLDGVGAVDTLIMLGTPNHGTWMPWITPDWLCSIYPPCEELRIGSDFLTNLNSGDETPGDVNYITVRGTKDILAMWGVALNGAENYAYPVGHGELHENTTVYNRFIKPSVMHCYDYCTNTYIIASCISNDGCCPGGCNSSNDNDCVECTKNSDCGEDDRCTVYICDDGVCKKYLKPGCDHPDDNKDVSTYCVPCNIYNYESESNPMIGVISNGFSTCLLNLLANCNEHCTLVSVYASSEELSNYSILVVPTGGFYGISSMPSFKSKIEQYVKNGGIFIVLAQQHGYEYHPVPGDLSGYGWLEDQSCHHRSVAINTYHPILSGQDSVTSDVNVDGYFTKYPENATVLLSRTKNGMPAMLMYEYGNGTVIATTAYTDWAYSQGQATTDGITIVRDMIAWAKDPKEISNYGRNDMVNFSINVTNMAFRYYPDYSTGDPINLSVNITNYATSLAASKVSFLVFDPDVAIFDYVNVSVPIAPSESKIVYFTWTVPPSPKSGAWFIYYQLLDANNTIIQEMYVSTFTINIVDLTTNLTADKIVFTVIDPDKHVLDHVNVSTTLLPGETKKINFTYTAPSKLGIWRMDYSLYNNRNLTQTTYEVQRFTVSKYAENPDGWVYQGKEISFSITSDAESYVYGSKAIFTFHIWNHGDEDKTISVTWGLIEHALGDIVPGGWDYGLNNSVIVPAKGVATFQYTLPKVVYTDGLRANFYENGNYLGSAEREFWVLYPSVDTNVETDQKEYAKGENVSISLKLTSNVDCNVSIMVRTFDPDNNKVFENTFNANLSAYESLTKTLSFTLTTTTEQGIYLVTVEAYSNGDKIGSGSTYFEVLDYIVRVNFDKPDKAYRIRENMDIYLEITNIGSALWESTINISIPDLAYEGSKYVSLNQNEREKFSYNLNIPETTAAGKHDIIVTIGFDDSVKHYYFVIPGSNLVLSSEKTSYNAGEYLYLNLTNAGGVDTESNCSIQISGPSLSLYENDTIQKSLLAGEMITLSFNIPEQVVSGRYYLLASCKDLNTGIITRFSKVYDIRGLKASLTSNTDKKAYFKDENVSIRTNITNLDGVIENGTLNLKIVYPYIPNSTSKMSYPNANINRTACILEIPEYEDTEYLLNVEPIENTESQENQLSHLSALRDLDFEFEPPVEEESNESSLPQIFSSESREIGNETVWKDKMIILNENLTINSTGKLTLINTTLIMNCSSDGEYLIEVRNGGGMHILDKSNITAMNANYEFCFQVRSGSTFEMRDSELHECGYTWSTNPDHAGLWINTNDAIIKNNSITNNYYGIILYYSSNSTIVNNDVASNSLSGIYLDYSSNNNISGNIASLNQYNGIFLSSSSNNTVADNNASSNNVNGIFLSSSSNNTVAGNIASSNSGNGIYLSSSSNNTVAGNIASSSVWSYGICLRSSSNNTVAGNIASLNQYDGIFLSSSSNNNISGNIASSNKFGAGIFLYYQSNNNNISGNNASSNNYGIFLRYSSNNNISGNNASSNNIKGISLSSSSSDNRIYNNYFSNTLNAFDDSNNIWNITKTPGTNIVGGPWLGGNYWSDYNGTDVDGDGLGDTLLPYNCFWNIMSGGDYLPLIKPKPRRGKTIWETNISITMAEDETKNIVTDVPRDMLKNVTGKIELISTLYSDMRQIIAHEDPFFYITDTNTSLILETDKMVYEPKETITIYGAVKNHGSQTEGYNLSIKKDGDEIFADAFTLNPNQTHDFALNTSANISFLLEGTVDGVTVTDFVSVETASINVCVIAPDVVGLADFDVGVLIENTGKISADLNVSINSTWNVTILEGETRLFETTMSITKNTTLNVTISGDVNQTIQKEIFFGENASINITPGDTYLEGTVEIPFLIENIGLLDSEFNATFSINDQTISENFFVPKGENISDSVSFNLTKGAYILRYVSPFETINTTINMLSPPEFVVASIYPEDMNFTIGQKVTLVFEVENIGGTEGEAALSLFIPDFEDTNRTWIRPGEKENISFNFTIPDDLEEKSYKGIYELDGERDEFTFFVYGANISVNACLDKDLYEENETALFTLNITNECPLNLSLYARVKLSDYEEVKHFNLTDVETLQFDVPVHFNGQKLFYGMYMESGRALYLNAMYVHKKEIITLYTDKQVYNAGENVTVFVDTTKSGTLTITAPGFNKSMIITGAAVLEFGLPKELRSGTYYIDYSFDGFSSAYPFDVIGYSARILECRLDKGVYNLTDVITVSMNVEVNQDISSVLKLWIYDTQNNLIDTFEMDRNFAEGENNIELSRDFSTSLSGIHVLVYGVYAYSDLIFLASGAEYFDVEGINQPPIADANGPYTGLEGFPITFDGTGSYDPDGTIVSYEWDLDDDSEFDDATGDTPTKIWDAPYSGNISLRVTDDEEATDTDTTTLTVEEAVDTIPPTIESVTLDAYTTIPDAAIHVTVEATDNVGVTTVTADSVSLVETESIWEGNITAPSATGSYTLTIRAEDAAKNIAETAVDYSVVKPSGSIGIGVDPRLTTVRAGDTALINIKLVSTENFDDIAYVYLTTEGLDPSYQANLMWFNWTSKYVKVPAGAEVNVPLEVSIPAGESGYKMFYAKLESTKWTPTAMDTGILYTI